MNIFRLLVALSVLAVPALGQLIDYRALGTNSYFTNGFIVNDKHWTNQSGLYRYQPGTGPVVNASPGPPFVIRRDGSTFVGTNVFQDVAPTAIGIYSPYVVSMTASNEPSTVHADWWAIDSEAYGVYGGAALTVQQGGASTFTLSGDTGVPISIVGLNATPGSDYIKINDNGIDRFVASGSATNVVHENAVGQSWLSIGQTNGVPTAKVRADGSIFYGKGTQATGDETDFTAVWFETVTTVNSNEPPLQFLNWQIKGWEPDGGFFDSYLSSRIFADKDAPITSLDLEAEGTNSSTRIRLYSAPGASQFEYKSNGVQKFAFDNLGDLIWLKGVAYSWPTAYGGANSVLTMPAANGTLVWSNIPALVTNNQARIGPGTINFIPKFITETNVTDSRVHQVETNQWNWNVRTNYGANTNGWTNRVYSSFTSTNNFQAVDYVINEPGANKYNGIFPVRGSGNTMAQNKFRLYDSWDINGVGSGVAPDGSGSFLPVDDDTLTIGNGSKRVKDMTVSRCYIGTPRDDTVIFSSGVGSQGFGISTAGSLYFTGPSLAGIQFNQSGLLGAAQLDIGQYGVGFGSTISNVLSSIRYGATAGLLAVGTNSAVAAPTSVGIISANASGTDHGSPDFITGGGSSTGTGTNGNFRVQTSEKSNSTSTTVNTATRKDRIFVIADPIILTTNSATVVANITIPTALRGVGGQVIAHTEIENGVDIATTDEIFTFTANRKGSTVVTGISAPVTCTSTSGGSAAIANTWTAVANSTSVDLKLTCVTSGIASTNSTVRITIIPNSSAVPVITHP